jgi:predicted MarR family transcription regulator
MSFRVDTDDFQTIKIQLRALGLITKSTKSRSVKDTATYWTLTPFGDTVMTRLRAIQKPHRQEASAGA